MNNFLARQNSHWPPVSASRIPIFRSDASEIVSALADELADNLNADWEPTEQGQRVSKILALVNTQQVVEWPQ